MRRSDASRSTRRTFWIAAVVVVITITAVIGTLVLSVREGLAPTDPAAILSWIGRIVAVVTFALSGALIVSRQPHNIIGWLLVIPGVVPAVSEMILLWLAGLDPPPTQVGPLLWLAVWFTGVSWVLLIFPIFLILLTFPNGQLLSPRWRWVVVLAVVAMLGMLVSTAISPLLDVTVDDVTVWSVPNPIASGGLDQGIANVFIPALLAVMVASLAAFVVRFRRGSSVEREQLKWPLWAIMFFGIVYGVAIFAAVLGGALEVFFGFGLAAIPISVAIAVLKYRLYEIDRIISRTVTYLLVVGLLGALYFALVTTVTRLFQTESPLAIAISTLAVAASFNPLRRRIQNAIDRRFNRAKYDAQNVMDRFATTLRDRLDVNELTLGWRDVVTETMQPTSVSVWIREGHT